MIYNLIKIMITTLLIVGISEIAKRSSLLAAAFASLPMISILTMIWLYIDTQDVTKIVALAYNILWFSVPALAFFISLPLLLKKGIDFYFSMGLACSLTGLCYFLMIVLLNRYGIKL